MNTLSDIISEKLTARIHRDYYSEWNVKCLIDCYQYRRLDIYSYEYEKYTFLNIILRVSRNEMGAHGHLQTMIINKTWYWDYWESEEFIMDKINELSNECYDLLLEELIRDKDKII